MGNNDVHTYTEPEFAEKCLSKGEGAVHVTKESCGAVFFDRDGTLNVDTGYLHEKDKFQWMPEAVEAIKYVNDHGYPAIVITNQSGVARGMFPESDVRALHKYMNEQLAKQGAHIDAFYYCPHHPQGSVAAYAGDCNCRKPKAGLIEQACRDFEIDLSKSYLIGDSPRDLECGRRAGLPESGLFLYEGGSLLDLMQQCMINGKQSYHA